MGLREWVVEVNLAMCGHAKSEGMGRRAFGK